MVVRCDLLMQADRFIYSMSKGAVLTMTYSARASVFARYMDSL